MRSKIAQNILDNTPQSVKDKVDKWAESRVNKVHIENIIHFCSINNIDSKLLTNE